MGLTVLPLCPLQKEMERKLFGPVFSPSRYQRPLRIRHHTGLLDYSNWFRIKD
jgi:hypothetical protein